LIEVVGRAPKTPNSYGVGEGQVLRLYTVSLHPFTHASS